MDARFPFGVMKMLWNWIEVVVVQPCDVLSPTELH